MEMKIMMMQPRCTAPLQPEDSGPGTGSMTLHLHLYEDDIYIDASVIIISTTKDPCRTDYPRIFQTKIFSPDVSPNQEIYTG